MAHGQMIWVSRHETILNGGDRYSPLPPRPAGISLKVPKREYLRVVR